MADEEGERKKDRTREKGEEQNHYINTQTHTHTYNKVKEIQILWHQGKYDCCKYAKGKYGACWKPSICGALQTGKNTWQRTNGYVWNFIISFWLYTIFTSTITIYRKWRRRRWWWWKNNSIISLTYIYTYICLLLHIVFECIFIWYKQMIVIFVQL